MATKCQRKIAHVQKVRADANANRKSSNASARASKHAHTHARIRPVCPLCYFGSRASFGRGEKDLKTIVPMMFLPLSVSVSVSSSISVSIKQKILFQMPKAVALVESFVDGCSKAPRTKHQASSIKLLGYQVMRL